MHSDFKILDSYETLESQELVVIGGGLNKIAYDIGHGLGVAANLHSTLKGIRRGGRSKRRH